MFARLSWLWLLASLLGNAIALSAAIALLVGVSLITVEPKRLDDFPEFPLLDLIALLAVPGVWGGVVASVQVPVLAQAGPEASRSAWITANAVAPLLLILAYMGAFPFIMPFVVVPTALVPLLEGAVSGCVLGGCQWFVLRQRAGREWILVTAAGLFMKVVAVRWLGMLMWTDWATYLVPVVVVMLTAGSLGLATAQGWLMERYADERALV